MLKKEYRLKKKSAFNATYKLGKSFHKNGITVFCGKNKPQECITKFGFVVSKKVHKRAVKRNRIKRLMRESVRLYIKESPNFDTKYLSIIFVGSTKILEKNFREVNDIVLKLMRMIENV